MLKEKVWPFKNEAHQSDYQYDAIHLREKKGKA